jgi:hypothetical protein
MLDINTFRTGARRGQAGPAGPVQVPQLHTDTLCTTCHPQKRAATRIWCGSRKNGAMQM